jgi:hypothetical protein
MFSPILDIKNELHELLTVTLVLKFLEIFAMDQVIGPVAELQVGHSRKGKKRHVSWCRGGGHISFENDSRHIGNLFIVLTDREMNHI